MAWPTAPAMRDTRVSLMSLCMRYQFITYLVLVLPHSPRVVNAFMQGEGAEEENEE